MIKKIIKIILSEKNYKTLIRYYIKIKFFGLKYKCPFCGGHFRKFYSAGFSYPVLKEKEVIGAGLRDNVRCPQCNSSNRERLFFLYLLKKTKNYSKKIKLLHIAPEKNLNIFLKKNLSVDYVSVDIESKLAMFNLDIQNMFFPDEIFDIVICSHVLEHIIDDSRAMNEIYRVMKKKSWAILQVPFSKKLANTYENSNIVTPEERGVVFGQPDHVRIYGNDYVRRLENSGFKVELLDCKDVVGGSAAKKYSLNMNEPLFVCYK